MHLSWWLYCRPREVRPSEWQKQVASIDKSNDARTEKDSDPNMILQWGLTWSNELAKTMGHTWPSTCLSYGHGTWMYDVRLPACIITVRFSRYKMFLFTNVAPRLLPWTHTAGNFPVDSNISFPCRSSSSRYAWRLINRVPTKKASCPLAASTRTHEARPACNLNTTHVYIYTNVCYTLHHMPMITLDTRSGAMWVI